MESTKVFVQERRTHSKNFFGGLAIIFTVLLVVFILMLVATFLIKNARANPNDPWENGATVKLDSAFLVEAVNLKPSYAQVNIGGSPFLPDPAGDGQISYGSICLGKGGDYVEWVGNDGEKVLLRYIVAMYGERVLFCPSGTLFFKDRSWLAEQRQKSFLRKGWYEEQKMVKYLIEEEAKRKNIPKEK